MLAITTLGTAGVKPWDPRCVLPFVGSCALGAVFLRHSRRSPAPFIPVRLLPGKSFLAMNLVNVGFGTVALGFAALVPLYAQNRYHLPIASAGTLLTARALGTVSLAGLAAMMLRRTGTRLPMVVGFSAIGFSLVMLAIEAPAGVPPYLWLAGWSLLTGLGMGVCTPASNNATLQLAPDQIAQIAGLRGMFRQSRRHPERLHHHGPAGSQQQSWHHSGLHVPGRSSRLAAHGRPRLHRPGPQRPLVAGANWNVAGERRRAPRIHSYGV